MSFMRVGHLKKARLSGTPSHAYVFIRWYKYFNMSIASERQQRQLASQKTGDNLVAGMGAFTFTTEKGQEIGSSPSKSHCRSSKEE